MTDKTEPNAIPAVDPETTAGAAPIEDTSISAPRKRGRPPKNPPANGDPNPVADDGKSTTSNARGRPRGKKGKVQFTDGDISTLAKQIAGLHKLAYVATGIPELEISDQEAVVLGGALASVAQEYNLELSGKTGAMLQLIAACGMIYVPRFMALQKRVAVAKAAQKVKLHVVADAEPAPAH